MSHSQKNDRWCLNALQKYAALADASPHSSSGGSFRRTALISDIHGNYRGLLTVLKDICARNCDRILCLGDLIDGGEEDNQVIEELKRLDVDCVQGNHDCFPSRNLKKWNWHFLNMLPERKVEEEIIYTHISPRKTARPIKTSIEAWNVFETTSWRICFVGHLHFSALYGKESEEKFQAKKHAFTYNQPYSLSRNDRYIISPGPIGYSRDEVDAIRYAIFDMDNYSIEFRVVEGTLLHL